MQLALFPPRPPEGTGEAHGNVTCHDVIILTASGMCASKIILL